METYKFNCMCSGLWVCQPLDTPETIAVTIDGQLNKDLNGAIGILMGEGRTVDWTAE